MRPRADLHVATRKRRTEMKNGLIGIGLCVGALAACAAEKPAPRPALALPARAATPPPALPSGKGEANLTGTATVQKVAPLSAGTTRRGPCRAPLRTARTL